MARLFTKDDFIDIIHKLKQRGFKFILSKFTTNGLKRTENTFNTTEYISADWWTIPQVKERWNVLISGDKDVDYKQFFVEEILNKKSDLKLISLGSGASNHEIELAKYDNFQEVICVDLAQERLSEATKKAKEQNVNNIELICADVNIYDFPDNYYDVFFFHASLKI